MEQLVTGNVLIVDALIYAGLSFIIFGIMDMYGNKRLGKNSLAMKALRFPRFVSMMIVSMYSMLLLVASMIGFTMKASTETYLGIVYFAVWFYYMVSVMHRVIAETKGK